MRFRNLAQAKQTRLPQRRRSRTARVAAPKGGLNSRDSIADMPALSAVAATNWFASQRGLTGRKGYRRHQIGLSAGAQTLMSYTSFQPSESRLFAIADGIIYDVTQRGVAPVAQSASPFSESYCQYSNFDFQSGHYLVVCNGADPPKLFNGTAWKDFTTVESPAEPGEVTSANINQWISVSMHMRRLWFVVKDSTKAEYLPVNSLGGAVSTFDFAGMFPRGGHLVQIVTWTIDAGEGLDDYLCALSSEGDYVVYKGTDPATSATWSLVGTYQSAPPLGLRPSTKFGGDVLVMTQQGLMALSTLLQSAQIKSTATVSNMIDPDLSTVANLYANQRGWQVVLYPGYDTLLINVPRGSPTANYQYAMNTVLGSWSLFEGFNALCWVVHNKTLYFSDPLGNICEAFNGFTDDADAFGLNGKPIVARGQQAYSDLGMPGLIKRMIRVKPVLIVRSADPVISVAINTNYRTSQNSGSLSLPPSSTSNWNYAVWNQGTWGAGSRVQTNWQDVDGLGTTASISITVAYDSETNWVDTEWLFEPGEPY